jgi:hypothetical protein
MHRSRALSIAPGTFFVAQSWADCITNMPGFNLQQAQALAQLPRPLSHDEQKIVVKAIALARLIDLHSASAAFEQGRSDLFFEFPDRVADRTRRQPEFAGGCTE